MEQNIYLDVYFGFNFLMDFCVLFITGILIKSRKNILRTTASAGIAALYSTIILVLNASGIIVMLFTYFFMTLIMLLIAFGKTNIKSTVKNFLTLYFVTVVMNGIINTFYYGTGFGKGIVERAVTNTFGNIDFSCILVILIVTVTTIAGITDVVKKHIKMNSNMYDTAVIVGAKKVCVKALCDTGNSLTEPITKRPVSIIERKCLKIFENEKLKYVMVPYNSVGKKHGLMEAFISDCIEVNGKIIDNAIIGIHDGKLSQDNKYQMLLHPDIICKRGDKN